MDQENVLEGGTYEVLKSRLDQGISSLKDTIRNLNKVRRDTFGGIKQQLIATERINTENNCIPRDMIAIGDLMLFGFNVYIGLKSIVNPGDVFSVHYYKDHQFSSAGMILLDDSQFKDDFQKLYKYYKETSFARFAQRGPFLYMIFNIGKEPTDIKAFKWQIEGSSLTYLDNRSEHEFVYPQQHDFKWKKTTRDDQRQGKFPHISIADELFVETIGGDLTIKIENNTDSGQGIYREEVENKDQTLDDAEIYYAIYGSLILLKIKPYLENDYRYIVFNRKLREARSIPSIKNASIFLPDDQGIIFSNGYYLQSGDYNILEGNDMLLYEKTIASPNGEDYLYIFFHQEEGRYVMLPFNIIQRNVLTPIICHGYALFENGEMAYFYADKTPKKHHVAKIWQTPFTGADFETVAENENYLSKIGNKEIVRVMAECQEIINLAEKGENYSGLYTDLQTLSKDILDSYHWLNHKEVFQLSVPLNEIHSAASSAIAEYEKVQRIRKETAEKVSETLERARAHIVRTNREANHTLKGFVDNLSVYRVLHGEVESLMQLRYVESDQIESMIRNLREENEKYAADCVRFLLRKEALIPYSERVDALTKSISDINKVTEAEEVENKIGALSGELELLIDIVGHLKIKDATQTTQIIENISGLFARVNQRRSELRKVRKKLLREESVAEFAVQMNLMEQGLTNYLDLCDTPQKADEYYAKLMIQLEELEGKFTEFEEFQERINERREMILEAFESRKALLNEQLNKRRQILLHSGERIILSMHNRVMKMKDSTEIQSYFSADLMSEKVRNIIKELHQLNDPVKAEDLTGKVKSLREDAMRQLRDRQELFSDQENVIKFGRFNFTINTQALDMTLVPRGDQLFFHLSGTNFYQKIEDEYLNNHKDMWGQILVSETDSVYRAEYLAYSLINKSVHVDNFPSPEALSAMENAELLSLVQTHMSRRFNEGYSKGIHDYDTTLLLKTLAEFYVKGGLIRFNSRIRAYGILLWCYLLPAEVKDSWDDRLKGLGLIYQVFEQPGIFEEASLELQPLLTTYMQGIIPEKNIKQVAGYLVQEIAFHSDFILSKEARHLSKKFEILLKEKKKSRAFEDSLIKAGKSALGKYRMVIQWLRAFHPEGSGEGSFIEETAMILWGAVSWRESEIPMKVTLKGLKGTHKLIGDQGEFDLQLNDFLEKMNGYFTTHAPAFRELQQRKQKLTQSFAEELRLDSFKPKVLTSFVRNRLINEIYLPLIGDNLAKQMGEAGEAKRTDLMGLLLLVSPPGYGKTTLMEYIANRLGLVFMKINGPSLGHQITSVDPQLALSATARQELEKLNLAFEMGDNVMIYLDDIQHLNPEFLQKFISLCDAQRKIEGVYKGKSKTYDFKGRKVSVVMAGNPYTESGEKFKIPDMLSNRADIYNLGDIIGDSDEVFKLSYLENCITSNQILNKLAGKSQKDLYALITAAENQSMQGLELESSHSPDEVTDFYEIFIKLIRIRDVIMNVNSHYVASAAQADAFRTEPSFKLQGSYRDMNKIAGKVYPVMNKEELQTLIRSHYESEAQSLTTGAEANLLKFNAINGWMDEKEKNRWDYILEIFQKEQKRKGYGDHQAVGQLVDEMEEISKVLSGIEKALRTTRQKKQ